MTVNFQHGYGFDPAHGFDRAALAAVEPPVVPDGFEAFWRRRHGAALAVDPRPSLTRTQDRVDGAIVYDVKIRTTGRARIFGWLVVPADDAPSRGLVVGHGYGGRGGPDRPGPPVPGAAVLYPCFRGLGRSIQAPISPDPQWHVLHDIDSRDDYVIGRCVEDLWLSVSALLALYPWIEGRIGYIGESFGGGIGALALPWDDRIARAQLSLPTFGHHPLRIRCPSIGSAAAIRRYAESHPEVVETLSFYDAAVAARFVRQPVLVAAALFDPSVPPPGQFAIYNGLTADKELFTLPAGHFAYDESSLQERRLRDRVSSFFQDL